MFKGGPIESITISGRTYAVAADSDSNTKLGGFENEAQANGNGTVRIVGVRVPWSITDANVAIDEEAGDQEFLQDLADSRTLVPITISFSNGAIYTGNGTVVGEIVKSSTNDTLPLSLAGEGKLTRL